MPPGAEDEDDDKGEGEGDEDEGDEEEDEDDKNDDSYDSSQALSKQNSAQEQKFTYLQRSNTLGNTRSQSIYGGTTLDQEDIYKDSNLFEVPDRLVGIAPTHYANITKDKCFHHADTAQHSSKEFAVVAFWELDSKDD